MKPSNDIELYVNQVKLARAAAKTKLAQLVSGPIGDAVIGTAKIAKAIRSGEYVDFLINQMEELRASGKLNEERMSEDEGKTAFQEVLEALSEDGLDEKRFRAIKALFFETIHINATKDTSRITLELMKILKELGLCELVVIFTAYRISKANTFSSSDMHGAQNWLAVVANESGYKHSALIERVEDKLMQTHLIYERTHPDRSGIRGQETMRLTPLAIELCQFIEKADPDLIYKK